MAGFAGFGQGVGDALGAISRQNIEKAQLAEMLFNLQRAKQFEQARPWTGQALMQMYGQGSPMAGTTAPPLPPAPGMQSMPPGGPPGPPGGQAAGPGGPAALPPLVAGAPPPMEGMPLPGPTPGGPSMSELMAANPGTGGQGFTVQALNGGRDVEVGPGVTTPGLTAPAVPPYKALPQPSAGSPEAPTTPGPPAPPGVATAERPPSPWAGVPSIMQAPDIQRFIQTAKQIGMPQEMLVDALQMANPSFALEYKAAIAGQNAYTRAMQIGVQQQRADTYADSEAAKAITRGQEQDRRDREEDRRTRQTDALIKKWEATTEKERAALKSGTPAAQQRAQIRNDDIEAARKYVLSNPPGSKGQKNDLTYQATVRKAMTQKLGGADPDYEQWQDYPADVEPTDTGPILQWFKDFFSRGTSAPASPAEGRSAGGKLNPAEEQELERLRDKYGRPPQ